ncbi:hypothetical protein HGRIS_000990 [Hohenbuehelia grisea]|uniref:Uncharacterized protein n=1 Tax=Hohenbuehelia grisea TaxID=104357 RepID=A0ABR3IQE6_9AGAR
MTFPTPVGGASLPFDFAPSVLFAVMYGCLVPILLWRCVHPRSWTLATAGSVIFSIERIVVFALRASQSNNESRRLSPGLLTYSQLTFATGYISIAQDIVSLVRCLIVNASFGTDLVSQSPAIEGARRATKKPTHAATLTSWPRLSLLASSSPTYEEIIERNPISEVVREGAPHFVDNPRYRSMARRYANTGAFTFLAATICGIVANSQFGKLLEDESKSQQVMTWRYVFSSRPYITTDNVLRNRYASTGITLALVIMTVGAVVLANMCMARISQPSTKIIFAVSLCMSIVAIYRLSVMFNRSDSLTSTAPEALNSSSAKALFYIFHAFPEWLSIALLFSCNLREICGTGPYADWRSHDETEKEREKRLKKEAIKLEALRTLSSPA